MKTPLAPLTETQKKVLEIFCRFIEEKGVSPSIGEVADAMGYKGRNSAREVLEAIYRRKYLDKVGGHYVVKHLADGTPVKLRLVRVDAPAASNGEDERERENLYQQYFGGLTQQQ